MTDLFTFTKCLAQQQCCSICYSLSSCYSALPFSLCISCSVFSLSRSPSLCLTYSFSSFNSFVLLSHFSSFLVLCKKHNIKWEKVDPKATTTIICLTSVELLPQIYFYRRQKQQQKQKYVAYKNKSIRSLHRNAYYVFYFIHGNMAYSSMYDELNSMIVKYITSIIAYYDDRSLG